MRLKKYLVTEPSVFDGSQFASQWMRKYFKEDQEGIIAFQGPFQPAGDLSISFADQELFQGCQLLHLVVRHHHRDVEKLRLQQRLLLDVAKDKLNHRLLQHPAHGDMVPKDIVPTDIVQRWGQDLRRGAEHLSVSAVQMTTAGAMIYLGIQEPRAAEQTPLPSGQGAKLDLLELAQAIMDQYVFEVESARQPIP
jgi:hypothetical protein